ncbi:hypothetical protein [Sphingomonas sp. S2-65]|uniref:hypothetical protein n=1 Tax=Sphingomonas sp. S2-65 TaxID=2903960 RepID=UPI001F3341B5|nr:hypothetical protein [Sphingomonas sp. S2-65]UYY58397.1 hypothetical protein LZ586_17355 [Sphingomonas sp. S2-65]
MPSDPLPLADRADLREVAVPQRASARMRWGERFAATAEVEVTPAGLLSIGGMVGMILLGSAAIVHAAGKARARR